MAEPMVPAPPTPVPTAIMRPLETAVIARSQYAAPPPTGPRPPSGTSTSSASTPPISTASAAPSAPSAAPAPAPSLAPEIITVRTAASAPREATAPTPSVALAPPPAAPAPPRVEPPPVSRVVVARPTMPTGWWVQVGAYRSVTTAARVAKEVRGEILVIAMPGDSEPLLRVRVGPFLDRAGAQARLQELEAQGWKAFLVSQ